MKKMQFIGICILCVILAAICIHMFALSTVQIVSTRISCGIITQIKEDNSLVFEDISGNEWILDDMTEWQIGDVIIIKFATNNTIIVEDDEVLSIEYCGHYERDN